MDSKVIAILAVVVVVCAGAGAGAYIMMNDDGKQSTEINSAADYAKQFVDSYSGEFGTFSVKDGATAEVAIVTSLVKQYYQLPTDEGQSSNSVQIFYYSTKDAASAKYDEIVASIPAASSMTVEKETVTLTGDDAAAHGCEKITLKICTRNFEDKAVDNGKTYSQTNGVALTGNYVIDFSQNGSKGGSTIDNLRLYYGVPIESTVAIDGDNIVTSMSKAHFKSVTLEFIDSFTGTKTVTSAKTYAENFKAAYSSEFGTFTVKDDSTDSVAVMTSQVKQYVQLPADEGISSNSVTIYYFADVSSAVSKYNELVAGIPTTSSMTAEKATYTLNDTSAVAFGMDKIALKVCTRNIEDKAVDNSKTYSQVNGVALDGHYVIDFSQNGSKGGSTADNVRLYYGVPIESTPAPGVESMTLVEFINVIAGFTDKL